ncbi:glycoside hydrolase family 16 protein [Apiosordaria backusii]|uniref:Glycoside hydrolase family 16 protein n=1 Tax=Apiosordaria backusii TaxID=314023 RepID=A0AA40ESK9_9PEZI|nr:glycoside hydrolase family 16 protein [Apiosordaria backusii]
MVHLPTFLTLLVSTAPVWAAIPSLPNYRLVWGDDFNWSAGSSVNRDPNNGWEVMRRSRFNNDNNEKQEYRDHTNNVRQSGNGELYIIPTKENGIWYSGRLQSFRSFSVPAGRAMVVQAEIKVPNFSGSPAKYQGLWPAFWALGQGIREGVKWPKCGEWDIMEVANNRGTWNQGTLHFALPGTNTITSRRGGIEYNGQEYHTWAIKIDRRKSDWRREEITFWRDGKVYHNVTGNSINNWGQWNELAHKPYFVLLNMAVGGLFGGAEGPATEGGLGSAVRVRYVGVYQSV